MSCQTAHCRLSYFTGPPTFHRYSHFCHWPSHVHDYFRDGLYHSAVAGLAQQLLGGAETVRVFDTFTMGSRPEVQHAVTVIGRKAGIPQVTLPVRWHSDYPLFTGADRCDNGVVAWLPLLQASHSDSNGMMFVRGSHHSHWQMVM